MESDHSQQRSIHSMSQHTAWHQWSLLWGNCLSLLQTKDGALNPAEEVPVLEWWYLVAITEEGGGGQRHHLPPWLKANLFVPPKNISWAPTLERHWGRDTGDMWCQSMIRVSSRDWLYSSALIVNHTVLHNYNLLKGRTHVICSYHIKKKRI